MYRLVLPRSRVVHINDKTYLNANDAKLISSLGPVLFWSRLEKDGRLKATFGCVEGARVNKLRRFREVVIFLPGLQKAILSLIFSRILGMRVIIYNGFNISLGIDWKSRITWIILRNIARRRNVRIVLNAPVDYLNLRDFSSNLSITRPVTSFFEAEPNEYDLPIDNYYCWIGNLSGRKNIENAKLISKDENVVFIGGDDFISDNHIGVGRLDISEVKYVLKRSKGLLITSKAEGFPRIAIEAASIGVPVFFEVRFDYVLAEEIIFEHRFYEWKDREDVDIKKYSKDLRIYFNKRLRLGKELVDVIKEK